MLKLRIIFWILNIIFYSRIHKYERLSDIYIFFILYTTMDFEGILGKKYKYKIPYATLLGIVIYFFANQNIFIYYNEVYNLRKKIEKSEEFFTKKNEKIYNSKELKEFFLKELSLINVSKKNYYVIEKQEKNYKYFYTDKREKIEFYDTSEYCKEWTIYLKHPVILKPTNNEICKIFVE